MTYKAYYYLKSSGRAPLAEYLKGLKEKQAVSDIIFAIVRLREEKCQLPPPFIKHVWKKVYELRLQHQRSQYRIFYFIYLQGKVILLDGYTKKTNKIPRRILKRVQCYYFDYLTNQYETEFKEKEVSQGSEY